jgi:hypothetical protein
MIIGAAGGGMGFVLLVAVLYRRRLSALAETARRQRDAARPKPAPSSSKRSAAKPLPPLGTPPTHAKRSFAELSTAPSARSQSTTPLTKAAAANTTAVPRSMSVSAAERRRADAVNFVDNPLKAGRRAGGSKKAEAKE